MLMEGLLLLSLVLGQTDAAKNTSDVSTKIRDLQAERIKVLERGMELVSMAYAEGARDFTCVYNLQLDLLDAKLDAASSKEEEINHEVLYLACSVSFSLSHYFPHIVFYFFTF